MDGSQALTRTVRTTCPYCGVGCGVVAQVAPDGAVTVAGDPAHPANRGRLCSKGSALAETLGLEARLLHPEVDGVTTTWEAALDATAARLRQTLADYGPEAVGFYVSGQLLTEDYYTVNKFAKGFLGVANLDTNSRLCMASSVAGHQRAFGADVVPVTYGDIEQADLVVLVGANLAWCHPILFQRLMASRKTRSVSVVTIDPRRTATAEESDLHLPILPGADVALFNGLLSHLQCAGKRAHKFVDQKTTGERATLAAAAAGGDLAAVAQACGLDIALVDRFFALFAEREKTITVYSQGVNQSTAGVDKVNAIINCHLFTGRIGRPGMGPFSVTGQPNAMGGREVGALANQLAAHMGYAPDDVDRVRRFWNAPRMATKPGLKAVDLFRAVESGRIRFLWVMATNPAVSLPDGDRVRRALETCPTVVVSDCARNSDTVARADIRLPALGWGEKEGSVTNSERRISRQRSFLAPAGEARPDWWIVSETARRLGQGAAFNYRSAADIFREHAALSAFENDGHRAFDIGALARLDEAEYDRLEPTQWPARVGEPPQERMFGAGKFYTTDGRAKLIAVSARGVRNAADARYPLRLNTGRLRDQWHTMTRSGSAPRLWRHTPEPTLDMHPEDADAAGLADGEYARVESQWGAMLVRVRRSGAQRRGDVFTPMHWSDPFGSVGRVNGLVNPETDPISGQPELKHTPVRVAPAPMAWFAFGMSRRPVPLDASLQWAVVPGLGHWRYEIAGASPDQIEDCMARFASADADVAEYVAGATVRRAWFLGDRLETCLFVAPDQRLPAREWLAQVIASEGLSTAERTAVLAGRLGPAVASNGPIVCSCFNVGRDAIRRCINAGAETVDAIGAAVQAGTNCGSCRPELAALLKT